MPAITIRPADPRDAIDVARIHVRAWQAGYRGLLPDEYLDALHPEDRASRYTFGDARADRPETIVALQDQTIRGFATTGKPADQTGRGVGELLALYVDPSYWRRGIGRRLIIESRHRLVQRGFATAILWVLEGNDPAERFYRSDRWAADGERRTAEAWGITANERRYRRRLP